MPDLPVSSGTVPANLECIIANDKWQELIALLFVNIAAGRGFAMQSNEPGPSERNDPWIKLNSDGTPDDLYVYAGGAWISSYKKGFVGMVVMWEGDPADIPTLDGGEVGAVTATTGPFWERVTEMDARFPIGPGTLPSTTVLAVGDQDGEEKHALALTEITPHTHRIRGEGFDEGATPSLPRKTIIDDEHNGSDNESDTESAGGTGSPAAVVPHNNLPPYTVICFIRRTARVYKRG